MVVFVISLVRAFKNASVASSSDAGEDWRCNINPKWDTGSKYATSSRTDRITFHAEGDCYKAFGEDYEY